ncbi:hypothetical protein HID58_033612 [Brassica napus]|uniref:RAB6-interacting golgin n=2 Tax=Brassica TaxID=3705 RepID=A0ABQ8BZR1_BRANA|nr:hypothetical protein HID58_033612 [Brassica napus]CAG7862118.1 unnamed protein product [Brassica rapa]VDC60379.1 unnamed protein product [Brassica rapa]
METEMTRIAFQEPSKNGTPLMPITPMQSPIPSSPGTQASELSKKELQMKTMREIKVEVEKVKGRLQDRLMKRLSAVECKAEEK